MRVRKTWPAIQMYTTPLTHIPRAIALCARVTSEELIPHPASFADIEEFAQQVLPCGRTQQYNLYMHTENDMRNVTLVRVGYDDNAPGHSVEGYYVWGPVVWTGSRDEAITTWLMYGRMHLS